MSSYEHFKQSGLSIALAIDEWGGTAGVLTLTDVLEAIVGDIPTPEEVANPRVVQRADGSWLLDGLLPVDELKELIGLGPLPEEGGYQTLGGFVLAQVRRIPAAADAFVWEGWRFEVMDMDGHRVDKVLVGRVPESGAA